MALLAWFVAICLRIRGFYEYTDYLRYALVQEALYPWSDEIVTRASTHLRNLPPRLRFFVTSGPGFGNQVIVIKTLY